jgi:hypothetical protein
MSGFAQKPNRCYHVYKVRRGKLNFIKVWIYSDGGTCRTKDLFVTKNDYTLLSVNPTEILASAQNNRGDSILSAPSIPDSIWQETEATQAEMDAMDEIQSKATKSSKTTKDTGFSLKQFKEGF